MLFLFMAWAIGCMCGWILNNIQRRALKWWRRNPKPKSDAVSGVTPGATKDAGAASSKSSSSCAAARPSLTKSLRGVHVSKYGSVAHTTPLCPTLKCATTTIQELPLCKVCGVATKAQSSKHD